MLEAYERMKSLLSSIGVRVDEGNEADGEIYAYSKAMELVYNKLTSAAAKLMLTELAKPDTSHYAELLNLDSGRFGGEALMNEITARLAHSYADYSADDVWRAFLRVGSGNMLLNYHTLLIYDVKMKDLKELGKFLASFAYLGGDLMYNDTGMTFDDWDGTELTFSEYDGLLLPFSILDNYRRIQ